MKKDYIRIYHATENNLKDLTLEIPKHQIVVVTGPSGSGKSSLVMDVIAATSRRELNDSFPAFAQRYLPQYRRPELGRIEGLPVAIVIDQKKPGKNVRSTLGTFTDCYTLLRLLFSRIGEPFVAYSDAFSFNHPQGKCPYCDGLGEITEIDPRKLVDFNKSLNESGVIRYVAYEPGQWRWEYYGYCGFFDNDKKIKDYTEEELELFLYQEPMIIKNPPEKYYKNGKYEGLMYRMNRMLKRADAKVHWKRLEPLVQQGICPHCKGARLNEKILSCKIGGKNIADVAKLSLTELLAWTKAIETPIAKDIKEALLSRVEAMISIGLPYLSLDRSMGTLSGGEAQRCKIAKYNNTSLSDMLYILDEPSAGLHSHDIYLLRRAVERLKERGNSVLLVEHNPEMIEMADYVIDMGPGAGVAGGEILFEGSKEAFWKAENETAKHLREGSDFSKKLREPKAWFSLKEAKRHNLKNLSVDLPLGVLTCIVGVAGSGKSSLVQEFLAQYPEDVCYIEQGDIGASLRSTPATYMKVAGEIRKLFAKATGKKANDFSFNGAGACPVCGGKGVLVSEMSFMDKVETDCESCHGLRYKKEVLEERYRGKNIAEVMDLTVRQAIEFFGEEKEGKKIAEKLEPLVETGLSYLHLNQALSTLSGGELQRMNLSSEKKTAKKVFVLDEPTTGLHVKDVRALLELFHEMVEAGKTVILVEHNLEVLKAADYAIEIGPYAGKEGGELLFAGRPEELLKEKKSITRKYLRKSLKK